MSNIRLYTLSLPIPCVVIGVFYELSIISFASYFYAPYRLTMHTKIRGQIILILIRVFIVCLKNVL